MYRPLSFTIAMLFVFLATLGPCRIVNAREASREVSADASVEANATDVETMLRGPLHEAFAEPVQLDAQAGTVVSKKPPEPIQEIPPEVRPDDENTVWIPGYWGWDTDREDFIWISGVWRIPPPGQRWVPGYWTEVEGGYQWIAGAWVAADAAEIDYLPYPPESLEHGPTSPAPSDDYYWVSGCWQYGDAGYAWQPGYWTTYRHDWVWVPAHYVWTPRGAVYVHGYWDYPLTRRGQIFANVYFRTDVYARSGFYFTPRVVVDVDRLMLHLFVDPDHHHYYWGDYHDPHYRAHGFYAWFDFHGHHGYDPLFAYYRADYGRRGINYEQRLRGWNEYYQKHADRRPAHTFDAQAKLAARVQGDANLKYSLLGDTVSEVLDRRDGGVRLQRLAEQQRRSIARSADELRGLSKQRVEVEGHSSVKAGDELPKVDGQKSPIPNVKLRLPVTQRFVLPKAVERPPLLDGRPKAVPRGQEQRITRPAPRNRKPEAFPKTPKETVPKRTIPEPRRQIPRPPRTGGRSLPGPL